MWRCERCGTDNFNNALKCARCGKKKPEKNGDNELQAPKSREALFRLIGNRKIALGATLLAVVLIAGIIIAHSFAAKEEADQLDDADMVTYLIMPDVNGKRTSEAIKLLEEAGFSLTVIEEKYSNNVEPDYVINADYNCGEAVPEGTQIKLLISKGPEVLQSSTPELSPTPSPTQASTPEPTTEIKRIQVPYVVGNTEDAAINLLHESGFSSITIIKDYSDTVEEGRIISSSLNEGATVAENTDITLYISKGIEAQLMPDVVDMEYSAAKAILEANGLNVTYRFKNSKSVAEGLVIEQSKTKGNTFNQGDSIQLTVSLGEHLFDIPNYRAVNDKQATEMLARAGFTVYWVDGPTDNAYEKGQYRYGENIDNWEDKAEHGEIFYITYLVPWAEFDGPVPTNLSMYPSAVGLFVGEALTIDAFMSFSYEDENRNNSNELIWSSSNPSVATVDNKGTVIAQSIGSATITATSVWNNKYKQSCLVEVIEYNS